jgi:ribonuclease G
VALPGHYLVLMPTVTGIGVSRRIADERERKRLRAIAERLRPEGMGLIVRTAAEGVEERDLADDVRFLLQLWAQVTERAASSRAPAVLHQDLGLIQRVVRDLFTGDVDRFVIDSPREFERVREFVGRFSPELRERVQLHPGPEPIFDAHGIEREIERALHRKVWLRSGGYLVFDRTEAATVIDVNTGKYVGRTDLATTILKTNLEAAAEIARQIRLRDIGGMILVDFIDMDSDKHRSRVVAAMTEAVRADRTKVHVLDLTALGLVEITRKRVYQDLEELMRMACPYCEGRGRVLSVQSAAVRARRELRRAAATTRSRVIVAQLHPDVAALLDEDGAWLQALGAQTGVTIVVRARPGMHLDRIVVAHGDGAAASDGNGRPDGKLAQTFWLDPIHGEDLDLPAEDERGRVGAGARRADHDAGWLARAWRRLLGGRAGAPSDGAAAGGGRYDAARARRR